MTRVIDRAFIRAFAKRQSGVESPVEENPALAPGPLTELPSESANDEPPLEPLASPPLATMVPEIVSVV